MISQERLKDLLQQYTGYSAECREEEEELPEDQFHCQETRDDVYSILECLEELAQHRKEYRWKVDRPPVEGKGYQYLGAYILKWKPEWGDPLVGVYEEMPWEDDDEQV